MAEDISALHKELEEKKPALDEASQQKEAVYQKRQTLRDEIAQLIRQIKELKRERNTFTDSVRELKRQKREHIAKQKELLETLKAHQAKMREIPRDGQKSNPDQLARQIERFEYMVETEALTPTKEQEIMDKIKQLRKEYDALSGSREIFSEYREVRKAFTQLNKEINTVKRQIQDEAAKSQEKHEAMLELSGKVDSIKEEIEKLDEEYEKKRGEFVEIAQQVKDIKQRLGIAIPEKKRIDEKKRQEVVEKKREENRKEMATLHQEVLDKIKAKKKLTTEDFLILQTSEEPKEDEQNP